MIHIYLSEPHLIKILKKLETDPDKELKKKLEKALGNSRIHSDEQWSWVNDPSLSYAEISTAIRVREEMHHLRIKDLMFIYGDPANAFLNDRVVRILKRSGCNTISDFLNLKIIQFRSIRNFGVGAQAAFFVALKKIIVNE